MVFCFKQHCCWGYNFQGKFESNKQYFGFKEEGAGGGFSFAEQNLEMPSSARYSGTLQCYEETKSQ